MKLPQLLSGACVIACRSTRHAHPDGIIFARDTRWWRGRRHCQRRKQERVQVGWQYQPALAGCADSRLTRKRRLKDGRRQDCLIPHTFPLPNRMGEAGPLTDPRRAPSPGLLKFQRSPNGRPEGRLRTRASAPQKYVALGRLACPTRLGSPAHFVADRAGPKQAQVTITDGDLLTNFAYREN